ncbi:MAG: hypothetical protein AB7F88_18560 [Pyrinomonadaceae bacterium]
MKKLNIAGLIAISLFAWGCGPDSVSNTKNANTNSNVSDAKRETITIAERPQKIKDQMAERGQQDSATPTLEIVEPKADSTLENSTVKVKLKLGGDLKGYAPHMDPETKAGNHIHVILDNQPYEAYYDLDQEFELRNVADGEHTLRVFPSRPWHESYKNEGAFQAVTFRVRNGGGDATKPTTTNAGNMMANAGSNANTASTPEGKDMQTSNSADVDLKQPLLTYSRPKGEYKGADADAIMLDFWLANTKLTGDGGEYRVRYTIDGGDAKFLDKWAPIWLSGWSAGKHTIKLELVDNSGNVVENGGYNSTTREITVVK